MDTERLRQEFQDAFNSSAQEGITRFRQKFPEAGEPRLSHVAFKFASIESYEETIEAARALGTVTQEEFGGKEISWVKLSAPLKKGDLTLEWLELVQPKDEKNAFDGVTSIGYAIPSLSKTVKLPSDRDSMIYRYQSLHAVDMAGGK